MARRGRKKRGVLTRKMIFALLFVVVAIGLTFGTIWGYNKISFSASGNLSFPASIVGTTGTYTEITSNPAPKMTTSSIYVTYAKDPGGHNYNISVIADKLSGQSQTAYDQTTFNNLYTNTSKTSPDSAYIATIGNESSVVSWDDVDTNNYNLATVTVSYYIKATAPSGGTGGTTVSLKYKVLGLGAVPTATDLTKEKEAMISMINSGTLPGPDAIAAYMAGSVTTTQPTPTVNPTTGATTNASTLAPGPVLNKNTQAGNQTTYSSATDIGVKIPGNDATSYTYKDYIKALYNFSLKMGGILVILMIIYAGYIYMTSQGDSAKLTSAKDIMFGSIMGFVMLVLLGVILQFVGLPTAENVQNGSDITNGNTNTTANKTP